MRSHTRKSAREMAASFYINCSQPLWKQWWRFGVCSFLLILSLVFVGCGSGQSAWKQYVDKGDYDRVISETRNYLASSNDVSAWYWLGVASFKKGHLDQARSAFEKIAQLNSTDPEQGHFYTLSLANLGGIYASENNLEKALLYYNEALQEQAIGWAFRERGWIYYRRKDFDAAIKDFDLAIQYASNANKIELREATRGKAYAYAGKGERDKSAALFASAYQVSPYNADRDLALIAYAKGEKEKTWRYLGGQGSIGIGLIPIDTVPGALIRNIVGGSTGEKAGLLKDDLIVQLNEMPIRDAASLIKAIPPLHPGSWATLSIMRGGEKREVIVEIGSLEDVLVTDPMLLPLIGK